MLLHHISITIAMALSDLKVMLIMIHFRSVVCTMEAYNALLVGMKMLIYYFILTVDDDDVTQKGKDGRTLRY